MTIRYLFCVSLLMGTSGQIVSGDFLKRAFGNEVTEHKTYTYDFDVKGQVQVEAAAGTVEITGWSKPQINIEATKRGQSKKELAKLKADIEVKDKEAKAKIKTVFKESHVNAVIDYTISVPHQCKVSVDTGSGNITIKNIHNNIDTHTGSGKTLISDARNKVQAKSGSGNITIMYANKGYGDTEVKTGSGNIVVSNAGGSVDAYTASGLLQVDHRALSAKDDITLKTASGNIALTLPTNVNAQIKASTTSGTIAPGNFPWERKKELVKRWAGEEATLTLGKGHAQVKLSSASGSIAVQQQ